MARTLNSGWNKVGPIDLASVRDINASTEADIIENIHHLQANLWTPAVLQTWHSDASFPYVVSGSTSYQLAGIWRLRKRRDLSAWTFRNRRGTTGSGPAAADIKVDWENGDGGATYNATENVTGGTSAAWSSLSLSQPTTSGRDILRLWVKDDGSCTIRVHSTCVEPTPLSSIAAGQSAEGFVPFDSQELAGDHPLTTYMRQQSFQNLDLIRETRRGVIAGWSEDWKIRSGQEAFRVSDSDWVLVQTHRFRSGHNETKIEWGCTGYRAGTSGAVKVATDYMEGIGTSQTVTLGTKAASPYTANIHDGTDLDCLPDKEGEVRVYVKGDGTNPAVLMGFTAWMENA